MELTQDKVEYRPSMMAAASCRRREGVTMMTQALQSAPSGHYRVKNVVKSEVLKIMTLRSTAVTVGLTVVAGLLVTGLVTQRRLAPQARVITPASTRPKSR